MDDIVAELERIKAKRIFVQFPEGLKMKILEICDRLQERGFETLVSMEPTYGACDVRDEEASRLGCDAILHIGHSDLGIKSKVPVVYWEYFYEVDPTPVLEKNSDKLKSYEKVGLVTSVQFVKALERVKRYLKNVGKRVYVTKELKYPGQVIGCNVNAALNLEKEVDCFLYVGAGKFHALGIGIKTDKPVLVLDLERSEIYGIEEEKEKLLRIMEWNKWKFKDSKVVGLVISWKKGQVRDFIKVKERVERMEKKVYVLAFDEVTKRKLEGLKVDFLINLACPRLGIDDITKFGIPILNYEFLDLDSFP